MCLAEAMLNEGAASAQRAASWNLRSIFPRRAQGKELCAKEHGYSDKEPRPVTFDCAERLPEATQMCLRIPR